MAGVEAPEKSDLAYSVYGDASDTEQLYRDFVRYPDTDGWPPERALSQRAAIAATLQGHEPPLGTPTTVFMAGGSGAGKSTMPTSGANVIAAQLDAPILNPDDMKKAIPEYAQLWDAGDEYAAWGAHEESSYMAAKALAVANDRGVNVVVDGTGDSGGTKFLDKIKAAEALGRNTKVVMVDIPTEEAIARAEARAANPSSPSYKRHVNEQEIRRVHASVARPAPPLARSGRQLGGLGQPGRAAEARRPSRQRRPDGDPAPGRLRANHEEGGRENMSEMIPHPISDVADWGSKPTGPMKITRSSEIKDPPRERALEEAMADERRADVDLPGGRRLTPLPPRPIQSAG